MKPALGQSVAPAGPRHGWFRSGSCGWYVGPPPWLQRLPELLHAHAMYLQSAWPSTHRESKCIVSCRSY